LFHPFSSGPPPNWQNLDLQTDGVFGISTEKAYDPADGSHGRNYIGPDTGKEDFIPMLAGTMNAPGYRKTLDDYNVHVNRLHTFIDLLKQSKKRLDQIVKNIGKAHPSPEDLKSYQPRNPDERRVLDLVLDRLPEYPDVDRLEFCETDRLIDLAQYHLEHGLNMKMTAQDTVRSAHPGRLIFST
jgi:hypothetical protein